jgi:transposase
LRARARRRATLRTFLRRWTGEDVEAAVEATTGWRFVVEEFRRAGATVQLAEPADTTAARGPKRRAKLCASPASTSGR